MVVAIIIRNYSIFNNNDNIIVLDALFSTNYVIPITIYVVNIAVNAYSYFYYYYSMHISLIELMLISEIT